MDIRRDLNHGVTLLETLTYLSLLSLLIAGLIPAFAMLHDSNDKVATEALLIGEGSSLVLRIETDLEAATRDIDAGSDTLVLGDVSYELKGERLFRTQGGFRAPALADAVTVSSFAAYETARDRIRFSIVLTRRTSSGSLVSRNFTGTGSPVLKP